MSEKLNVPPITIREDDSGGKRSGVRDDDTALVQDYVEDKLDLTHINCDELNELDIQFVIKNK